MLNHLNISCVVRFPVAAGPARPATTSPPAGASLATSSPTTAVWTLTSVRTVPVSPQPSVSTPLEPTSASVRQEQSRTSSGAVKPLTSVSLITTVPSQPAVSTENARTPATSLAPVERTPSVPRPTTGRCAPAPLAPTGTRRCAASSWSASQTSSVPGREPA